MTRLYLASTSPRRRELLTAAGFKFTLLRPAPDPPAPATTPDPARLAIAHARHKAMSVTPDRPDSKRRASSITGLIIGADTIVVLRNRILGKPRNPLQAKQMLEDLSGRTHRVISGLAVYRTADRRTRTAAEETRVTFRRLSPAAIQRYIETNEPYDKAGAYGIQGRAGAFIARLQGSYNNVVGLPLARLLTLLEPDIS